jgi:hypothetical protein
LFGHIQYVPSKADTICGVKLQRRAQPNTSDISRVDMRNIPTSVCKTRALLKFQTETTDSSLENDNYRSIDIITSREFSDSVWCETWSVTLWEEHSLRVFENRMLRRIFEPKRDEVMGGWRKLRNERIHNLYSSPNIIRKIKSKRMRWAGHVA